MSRIYRGQGARGGVSLTEAIIASFILTFVLLSVTLMLNNGIDMDGKAERNRLAVSIARKRLANVRVWARSVANFYGSWTSQNTTVNDDEFPMYQVATTVVQASMMSPCSTLEAAYAAVGSPAQDCRRYMPTSFYKVGISVSWNPGDPASTRSITSLIGAPTQVVSSTVVGVANTTISHDGTTAVNGVAYDAAGNAVNDTFFNYYQYPTQTNGSVGKFLNPTLPGCRSGRFNVFENFYSVSPSGTNIYGPTGNLTISAVARSPILNSAGNTVVELVP